MTDADGRAGGDAATDADGETDGDEVTDGDRETDSERERSLGPLDTVVRRADGSHALGLRHESRAPFLSGFPPESR